MTCIQKFHLLLLNTSNIFTWPLIYKKNAQISLRYHPEVTSKPIPLPSPPLTPTLDKCPAVPMLYCILKHITCAHDLKEFLTQTSSQGYSHSIFLTESKPLNLYRGRFSHFHYFFWKVFQLFVAEEIPEGGLLPYKSDGGARRKISRTALKGDRILFHGPVPNSFPPLRGTNSTTINYINGTTNYNSNEDNFKNTFFSRTFMKVLS